MLNPPREKVATPYPEWAKEALTHWSGRGVRIWGALLSHPHPRELSPALPMGWSFGWQLGSYLFFFLMYKTCKRRTSVKWPGTEALSSPSGQETH